MKEAQKDRLRSLLDHPATREEVVERVFYFLLEMMAEGARAEPEAAERVRSLATSPEWEAQMRRRLRGIVEKHVKEV